MTEFVIGLRAKMYAVRVDGKKDIKKAKGVKNNVTARTITFNHTRCLNEKIEMTRRQSYIWSKYEVYTISKSKIALSPYDKRYVNSTDITVGALADTFVIYITIITYCNLHFFYI